MIPVSRDTQCELLLNCEARALESYTTALVEGVLEERRHTSFSRRRARVGEIGARRAPDNLGVSHAWIMGNLANAPHLAPRGFA